MAYRYEETVPFSPVVRFFYLIMLIVFFAVVLQGLVDSEPGSIPVDYIALILVGLVLLAIPLLFGRFMIRVDEENLNATWGYLGWPKQVIPLSTIEKSDVITYKALRQFGGWGIRCGKIDGEKAACYTLRGDRGVLLTLSQSIRVCFSNTKRFLLGSQEPERLHQALIR